MTTTLNNIVDAYRESNITAISDTLTTDQQTEGLRLLNSVVSSVYGYEVGEQVKDWPVGSVNYREGIPGWSELRWSRLISNVRLIINVDQPQTIWMPIEPDDGARIMLIDVLGNLATYPLTLDGNGRNIEGANQLVINTSGANMVFMYRADLGNWVQLNPITDVTAEFVFPPEFDAAFITMLAMRLNPRYGRQIAAESAKWMERSISQLRARYKQRVVTAADLGVLVMSVQAYRRYYYRGAYVNPGFGGLGLIG